MAAKFEIERQRTLRPDAVPIIFERKVAQGAAPSSSKKRAANCSLSQDIPKLQIRQGQPLRRERGQG